MIVSIYEIYTSAFRFSRLQKAADLLSKIEELDSRGTNASPELLRARKALVAQSVEAIDSKPITLQFVPSTLKFSMDGVWKFRSEEHMSELQLLTNLVCRLLLEIGRVHF